MSIVQNLMLKRLVIFCKYAVSKVSCLSWHVQVSVSERQCFVSVSKILAETPALVERQLSDLNFYSDCHLIPIETTKK